MVAEAATGCAPRYAAVGDGAAAEAAECAPGALAEGFLKNRFSQTSVALSGIASAEEATNLWLGAVAADGCLPSPDFAANWSLDRVPDRENLDCACVATNLVIDDSVIHFAPLTLLFKGTWQGYRLEFHRDFELQRLECQDGTAGAAGVHAGRVQVGTADCPVTLALSGGTAPLDFRQSSSGWNYVRLAPGSVIDFCGEEIVFPKSLVGKTSSDGAMQSSGYFEDAACSSNGTIRFSTAGGTIRLAGQGLDKGAIRLGYNNLELRSDQTWVAEPTAYVSLNTRQTPEGAKGPVFPTPLDSKRLDNLGQVNFSICGQPLADATPLTGLHLSGGTYGSLHFCSSGTTRRRQCITLDGDVALRGEVVETPMQSGGEAQTRPYSLTLATYTSPGSLALYLDGHALDLANGLRLDAGATGDEGSFCRLEAAGSILRIGGDLLISDAAQPGAAEHGIHLDASATLELGGDYHTSQTSVSTSHPQLCEGNICILGNESARQVWEIADAASTTNADRGTLALGRLTLGAPLRAAHLRLVNECLNLNHSIGLDTPSGEQLIVSNLSLESTSSLDLDGQRLRIVQTLALAPAATINLGDRLAARKGTILRHSMVGNGDQTATWASYSGQIRLGSTGATLAPVFDTQSGETYWQVQAFPQRSLLLIQ